MLIQALWIFLHFTALSAILDADDHTFHKLILPIAKIRPQYELHHKPSI
jgi:hypothetical protein